MCDNCDRGDAPIQIKGSYADAGTQGQIGGAPKQAKPTMRDRLEEKRNRLMRQLAQIEVALQLIYTNPDAEKIYEVLDRV